MKQDELEAAIDLASNSLNQRASIGEGPTLKALRNAQEVDTVNHSQSRLSSWNYLKIQTIILPYGQS